MYKSSLSLLAGHASSGATALKKNIWFQEISQCGDIILEELSFTKVGQRG